MSYHNLAAMFSGSGAAASVAFDTWLNEAVLDTSARDEKLIAWRSAPGGRESHPREEHLIPLMVAAGAANGDKAVRAFSDSLAGKAISGFQFG
jgi:aromatic ring-opening dioxygenase catalytic subunit (LigB family)